MNSARRLRQFLDSANQLDWVGEAGVSACFHCLTAHLPSSLGLELAFDEVDEVRVHRDAPARQESNNFFHRRLRLLRQQFSNGCRFLSALSLAPSVRVRLAPWH